MSTSVISVDDRVITVNECYNCRLECYDCRRVLTVILSVITVDRRVLFITVDKEKKEHLTKIAPTGYRTILVSLKLGTCTYFSQVCCSQKITVLHLRVKEEPIRKFCGYKISQISRFSINLQNLIPVGKVATTKS